MNDLTKIIHKADTRGYHDYGWLKTNHTFSFSRYYNPERMHFGKLRVLNDDIILPGYGFDLHSHENMEIITIPIAGILEHRDSEGHQQLIRPNDVQIMSAGTGIRHAEYNYSKEENVNLLQIWILPKEINIKPRYEQKTYPQEDRKNMLQMVVSPNKIDRTLWINQDAYISRIALDADRTMQYKLNNKEHGLYIFVIDGNIKITDTQLGPRDAVGLINAPEVKIYAENNSELVFLEVPLS